MSCPLSGASTIPVGCHFGLRSCQARRADGGRCGWLPPSGSAGYWATAGVVADQPASFVVLYRYVSVEGSRGVGHEAGHRVHKGPAGHPSVARCGGGRACARYRRRGGRQAHDHRSPAAGAQVALPLPLQAAYCVPHVSRPMLDVWVFVQGRQGRPAAA